MPGPRLEIEYCPRCNWLARAAWMAQELLTTFENELGEAALIPSGTGGTFEVRLDGAIVYRRVKGSFPEPKAIKRQLRDLIAPSRDLGHSDAERSE